MAKSKTKDYTGFSGKLFGYKTHKTTISGGGRTVHGYGISSKKAEKSASKKWHK